MVLGAADTVTAVPGEDAQILIEKSQKNTVTTRVELDEAVTAPVSQGQKLGTLSLLAGDQVIAQVPLVAAQPVAKLSWGQMFKQVIKSICLG